MPGYGFMACWEDALLAGKKTTTIRAERKDGRVPKVGERFVAFVGMRTKNCRRLFESTTRKVSPIRMRRIEGGLYGEGVLIKYDGRGPWVGIRGVQLASIARRDGFWSAQKFLDFFLPDGKPRFRGYLITFHAPAGAKGGRA